MIKFDMDDIIARLIGWVDIYIFNMNLLIQFFGLLLTFIIALVVSKLLRPKIGNLLSDLANRWKRRQRIVEVLNVILFPAFWAMIQWVVNIVFFELGYKHDLLRITASLLNSWIVILIFVRLVPTNIFWRRIVAFIAWTIAALNSVNLLKPTIVILNDIGFYVGGTKVSASPITRNLRLQYSSTAVIV